LYVSDKLRDSEMWKLEQASDGGCVHLVSKKHHRLVSCDGGGNLSTRSGTPSASEAWCLEPCMPPTITGESMRNLAIGGSDAPAAVTVASIVMAPFSVMGIGASLGYAGAPILGSLGYGAGAIDCASGVAGTKTAESIAGTTAAMGAGAVVGASAIGISAAASGGRTSMGESTAATNPGGNRPFCDWRSW